MQKLIIPDLWIPLPGLLWSWYRIHYRRSRYFCVLMIQWYLNLAQSLKTFQNCLTMLHTMAPTNWMDTTLWVLCSAYLSGIMIRCLTFPFHLVIVYGRKIIQTGTGSIHNLARYAGISQQRSCHHPLWQLALHLRIPVGWDVLPNMENIFLLRTILCFPVKRSVIIIPASAGVLLRSSATGKSLPIAILLNNAISLQGW